MQTSTGLAWRANLSAKSAKAANRVSAVGGTVSETPGEVPPLVVRDVGKSYAGSTVLSKIDFVIERGSLTSLLGVNGAGKTTLLETILGMRRLDSGEIRLLGRSNRELSTSQRRRMGCVLQSQNLPPLLKLGEYIQLVSAAYGAGSDKTALLEEFALTASWAQRIGRLSGGQKRKLALAAAVMARPELLILDEPTANLDPFSRLAFWQALRGLSEDPTVRCAVLMATHDMAEATELSTNTLILDCGRILAAGTPAALIARYGKPAQVRIPVTDLALWCDLRTQPDQPAVALEVDDTTPGRTVLTCAMSDLETVLLSCLRPALDPSRLCPQLSTLEDVFVQLLTPGTRMKAN